jgi:DNA-binding NtrC family response regulator
VVQPPAPASLVLPPAPDAPDPIDRIKEYPVAPIAAAPAAVSPKPGETLALRVLWVDDDPKGNAYEIEAIRAAGGSVEISLSTADGLARYEQGRYQVVITDLGRREGKVYNYDAGFELIKAIRLIDKTVPILVYTAASGLSKKRKVIEELGAQGITASTVELFEMLRKVSHG